MNSQTVPQFWRWYDRLPPHIQRQADQAYRRWQTNPQARGLSFKQVGKTRPVYAVRITDNYRALGLLEGDTITWFWIGNHDQYMRLLKNM